MQRLHFSIEDDWSLNHKFEKTYSLLQELVYKDVHCENLQTVSFQWILRKGNIDKYQKPAWITSDLEAFTINKTACVERKNQLNRLITVFNLNQTSIGKIYWQMISWIEEISLITVNESPQNEEKRQKYWCTKEISVNAEIKPTLTIRIIQPVDNGL